MACQKCGCEDVVEKERGPHLGQYCAGCGAFDRWLPKPRSIEESLEAVMPFGKHKGTKLSELPPDYIRWCIENLENRGIKDMLKLVLVAKDIASP